MLLDSLLFRVQHPVLIFFCLMAILCLGATDKPQELDGVVLPQQLVDDVIRRLVRFIPTYMECYCFFVGLIVYAA